MRNTKEIIEIWGAALGLTALSLLLLFVIASLVRGILFVTGILR